MKKVLVTVCVTLLFVLCGCGTGHNDALSSDNIESEFSQSSTRQTVENVSFDIPDNWERKDVGETTYFYTPNGASLCYCSASLDVDFIDVEEAYMQGLADTLIENADSVEVIEEDRPYFCIDGDYNNMFFRGHIKYTADKIDYVMTVYVTQKDDNIYQFAMTAQGNEYVYDDAVEALILRTIEIE